MRVFGPRHNEVEGDPYVPGHGDIRFDAESYDLTLNYKPAGNYLEGAAVIACRMTADAVNRIEFDLHSALKVNKVSVKGASVARYGHERSRLFIRFDQPLEIGTEFTVTITYNGSPHPMRGIDGDAGWEELTDGVIVASQPHGSPTWFPCNDRASNKAPYRFTVTTDAAYTVVANGTLTSRRHRGRVVKWVYDAPHPMSPYLATLQIGMYQVAQIDTKPVPVSLVYPPRLRADVRGAFRDQAKMVSFLASRFGPYPFDTYAAVITDDELEIPLESQTLSTFGANFANRDWESQRLIVHELAHQWFGNALTAANWQDIWLHEGFACYSEWLWAEEVGYAKTDSLAHMYSEKLSHLPQDIHLHNPGPDDMFDDRIYKRGALTLHALRHRMGDRVFFEFLQAWVANNMYGLVTSEMFVAAASEAAGVDLAPFFDAWLDQKGLPALN